MVDGNIVSCTGWPDLPEFSRAFMGVLERARCLCESRDRTRRNKSRRNHGTTVTLFTGQWADLPLEELAPLAKEMGYDGLELACWGDHFEVDKALKDDGYVERQREILEGNGLNASPSATTWSAKPSAISP